MAQPEATQTLAEFAARIRLEDVPERVKSYSKNLLLDALACAVAGHAGEEVSQVSAFATALSPGSENSIIAGERHSLVGAFAS
ncbi:MAG: MmgE/PrpD family protein [Pseudolabrys sp.]